MYNDEVYVPNGNGYVQVYSPHGEYLRRLDVSRDVPFFSDGLRCVTAFKDRLYYVAATDAGRMGNVGHVNL